MAHAIDDADWPWFRRLMRDYISGRLTRRPKSEGRPGGGRGGSLKLGRSIEPIEKGKHGKIKKLSGRQGKEKTIGPELKVYSRFGDVDSDADLLYTRINGKLEIIQSWCDPFEFSDEEDPPPEEEES